MPKRLPKIRITKNDKHEYRRLVRNTRAKIRRVGKKYGIDLSEQIDIPSLESFKHRVDFNKFKERMHSFTNRGNKDYQFVKNKYGVSASKAELNRIEKDTKTAQERQQALIDDLKGRPVYSQGEKDGSISENIRLMGEGDATGIHVPKDFDFDKIKSRKELEHKAETMKERTKPGYNEEKKEVMQDNLIELMEQALGSDGEEVVNYLKNSSAEQFYQLFVSIDELDFNLYASGDGENDAWILPDISPKDIADAVGEGIKSFRRDNKNMDLDVFP